MLLDVHVKHHELKIWPEYFEAVIRGDKRFEYRNNDRNYEVGDTLCLNEYNKEENKYTGLRTYVRITYILKLYDSYAILSIKPIKDDLQLPLPGL